MPDNIHDPSSAGQETECGGESGAPVLVLKGDVGLGGCGALQRKAARLAAGAGAVTLDWSAAGHLHAGTLQVLLALEAALARQGRPLHVSADQPAVRDLLELAGLAGHFRTAPPPAPGGDAPEQV